MFTIKKKLSSPLLFHCNAVLSSPRCVVNLVIYSNIGRTVTVYKLWRGWSSQYLRHSTITIWAEKKMPFGPFSKTGWTSQQSFWPVDISWLYFLNLSGGGVELCHLLHSVSEISPLKFQQDMILERSNRSVGLLISIQCNEKSREYFLVVDEVLNLVFSERAGRNYLVATAVRSQGTYSLIRRRKLDWKKLLEVKRCMLHSFSTLPFMFSFATF